ncbi:MAG: TIGR03545 family protein [Elusimicrobiota bacterium]
MRWKGFITLAVLIALITGGALFFLDGVLQKSITGAGTKIWGAKVEMDDLSLSWSPPGMKIDDFKVASRNEEFKNIFQVDSLNISVLIRPLLEKKINIEEISGQGLAFNTDREESGFLPEEEIEERKETQSRWKEKMTGWLENIRSRAKEKIDVSGAVETPQLSSVKTVKETGESLEDAKAKYENMELPDGSKHIDRLAEDYQDLKSIKIENEKDILQARDRIKKANDNLEDAKDFISQTNEKIADFKNTVTELSGKLNTIDKARREDYKAIMEKLQLPSIGVKDIAQTVFGDPVVTNFERVMDYVKLVRKYIPPKKEEKKQKVKKEREKGADIVFKREKMYPPFLIQKAQLTGPDEQYIKISDYTTTPGIHGKPVRFDVASNKIKLGLGVYRLPEKTGEVLELKHDRFEVGGAKGELSLNGEFSGQNIDSDIKWTGRGVMPENWLNYLDLEDPVVDIMIQVSGKMSSPKFSIRSNLDNIISDRLKEELDEKIKEVRREVEKTVDREVNSRKRKVEKNIEDFRQKQLENLNREKSKVLEKKREIEEEIEAKRREIEKVISEKSKQAQEKLEDKAGEELDKLFK